MSPERLTLLTQRVANHEPLFQPGDVSEAIVRTRRRIERRPRRPAVVYQLRQSPRTGRLYGITLQHGAWCVRPYLHGKLLYLGRFASYREAEIVLVAWARGQRDDVA